MDKNIKEYYNQFESIFEICKGLMNEEDSFRSMFAFAFICRVDCLIRKKAKECERFYDENRSRLSDERMDTELQKIVGGYPFYNVSGHTLYSISSSRTSTEVRFRLYINGFSSNVGEILYRLDFERPLALLRRNLIGLVGVMSILDRIDMSEEVFSVNDFEQLIERLKANIFNAKLGMSELYTSEPVSKLMVECLINKDYFKNIHSTNISIYDPVCGTGSLIINAKNKALSYGYDIKDVQISGQDVNSEMVALTNAMLLFNNSSVAKCGNTLLEDCFEGQSYQYILGACPFGLSWKTIRNQITQMNGFGHFSMGLPTVNDGQFLFIQQMMSKMDSSGSRIATLTTGNALLGGVAGSGENKIRRRMIERDLVETIISLPAGTLYPTTSIPVYMWILSNRKEKIKRGRIQLIDGGNFASQQRNKCAIDDKSIKRILSEYENYSDTEYSKIIHNEGFVYFQISLHHSGLKHADIRQIPSGVNIDNYIATEVQPYVKGKVEVDYSSVEKGCTIHFNEFFEKRLEKFSLEKAFNNVEELSTEIEIFTKKAKVCSSLHGSRELKKVSSLLYSAIPANWKEMPLFVIANIVKGQAKPRSEKNEDGLPYVVLSTLRGEENNVTRYMATAKSKLLSEKDVVIAVDGSSSGEVFAGMEGILSQSLVMLQPKDKVLPKFLYYLIKAHERLLKTMTKGAGIPHIDMNALKSIKLFIPSMEEQSSIVSMLDDVIENIERICKLLESNNNSYTTYRQALIESVIFGKKTGALYSVH